MVCTASCAATRWLIKHAVRMTTAIGRCQSVGPAVVGSPSSGYLNYFFFSAVAGWYFRPLFALPHCVFLSLSLYVCVCVSFPFSRGLSKHGGPFTGFRLPNKSSVSSSRRRSSPTSRWRDLRISGAVWCFFLSVLVYFLIFCVFFSYLFHFSGFYLAALFARFFFFR